MLEHPALDHRAGSFPYIECGIEFSRYAFHHDHGLLQQHQLRLKLHVETPRGFKQLLKQAAHRNFLCRETEDRFTDGTERLGECLDVVLFRYEPVVEMDLRNAEIIAREKTCQRFRHEAPHAGIEPAHNAEIDCAYTAACIYKQVARMHICVEKTVAQRLRQETAHHHNRDSRGI